MKILVTGSEGFIGKNLCEKLEKMGHGVIGKDIKRGWDVATTIYSDKYEVDLIYHLACVNQMDAIANPMENTLTNAYGAKRMADLAKKLGIKLIYTSTASVYGNAKTIPTSIFCPINPISDYAAAKHAGEVFVRNSGCNYTILRLSNVYGPHQTVDNPYCGVIGRFIECAEQKIPLPVIGSGTQTRDFTYVGDVIDYLVEYTYFPSVKHKNQTLNVSGGKETAIITLARLIGEKMGFNQVEFVSGRPIDKIPRRCLDSDLFCGTTLISGLDRTIKWHYANRAGRESLGESLIC